MTQPAYRQQRGRAAFTLAFVSLSSIISACGGSQRAGGLLELEQDVAIQSILELVPANVAFAYLADFDEDDAARIRMQWGSSMLGPVFGAMIHEQTGHDLADPEQLAEIGVDLLGEFGIYSTTALPIGIARLAEPSKFEAFVSDFRTQNPDRVWSSFPIADEVFWSTPIEETAGVELHVDIGVVGNYALVRIRSNVEGSFVDDQSLAALIGGSPAPSLAEDLRVLNLQERADGPITAVGLIDTQLIRKAIPLFVTLGWVRHSNPLVELLPRDSDGGNPECDAVSNAIAEAMPWHGGVQFRTGDTRRGIHVSQLSEAAAARARGIVGGTSLEAFDAASESPFFAALNVNLDAALELMNGDPRMGNECADLGAISGLFATMREQLNAQVRESIQKLTGLVMFTLQNFSVTGFIPQINAGIAIASSNPVPLTESFQSMLNETGATGRVDDTAPFTTFEYSLLGYEIRISQLTDRVVVATDEVPIALFNAMAVSEDRSGQFVEVRLQGPPIAAMIEESLRYLGNAPPDVQDQFAAMVSNYEAIESMTYNLGLDGNSIVGTLTVQLSPLDSE